MALKLLECQEQFMVHPFLKKGSQCEGKLVK